ncbi:MAG: hypothetical protein KH068_00320 [Prevotella sp.]|jgi:hypothetical protein|nr:hypothetical protein [Prevotella sp.]MBS7206821.1 hypothetical protein [Prevotella sp.]
MDKLQRTFSDSYVTNLKNDVKTGVSIEKYSADEFDIDTTKLKYVANVYTPTDLLENMMASQNDFEAAVILYEAYKDIPLVLASNEAFWTYLCHTELFEYCKKRYPVDDAKNKTSHILDHWFFGNGYNRNTLAQLWWGVQETFDEKCIDNPYHLTEIFFRNYSFRVIWFTKMLRTKQGLLGILDFLEENQDIMEESFEHRGFFIAKYFNRLGGTKQISFLPREFFKKELESIKGTILAIKSRNDVSNLDASQIIKQTQLDHTKYCINGSEPLSKGRLAVRIVKEYVKKNPSLTFNEIKQVFPDDLILSKYRGQGLIVSVEDLSNSPLEPIYRNKRYYFDTKEFWLKSSDGIYFVVNNQWDINCINNIINVGRDAGFDITIE